jgi:peptidoglycan/xylan/chitin deacetylase (PgdA/CDA1 family)
MNTQRAGLPASAEDDGLHRPGSAIPILLYHSVPSGSAHARDRLAVPAERFAEHLDAILASGRTPLTVGALAAGMRGEHPLPERVLAVTFDDGYADTPDAVSLLLERGVHASVYVTTGKVGESSMIGFEQLEMLAQAPGIVELGAHTVTHPHLDELGSAEIEREVLLSKLQLEELIGRRVESFAYPYGSYDRRVRAVVAAAGFRSAVAVKNALSHPADDPFALARWTVRATTTAEQIAAVLDGRGVPRSWTQERLRTRSHRGARRLRRRISQAVVPWR